MIVPIPIIHFKVELKATVDINKLIDQLKKKPVMPEDLKVNVSEKVSVSENISVSVSSSVQPKGSLEIVKKTDNPTKKELEVIQAVRGNRSYNSIFNVRIGYDERGNITSMQWDET